MKKPTPPPVRVIREDVNINWANIRLTCAWLLFGLGCIPAVALVAFIAIISLTALTCIAILLAIAIACILPGMLIAPNRALNFVHEKKDVNVKATWDWGKIVTKGKDND
jgi:hypothetical protein